MTLKQIQEDMATRLFQTTPIDRGSWQSGASPSPAYELQNETLVIPVADYMRDWQWFCSAADLHWAEEHFLERISGEPMNPAPSYVRWPWHSEKYREVYKSAKPEVFDHTYPERFWPKGAGEDDPWNTFPLTGIRFQYGDLNDLIALLRRDPFTRQAYLPVWFPEDTGATQGQRVPCTLGYHFIRNGTNLDMNYFIRSCDLTRHFMNDVYMAGRLLQWVAGKVMDSASMPFCGTLTMFISNLHMFTADEWRFR